MNNILKQVILGKITDKIKSCEYRTMVKFGVLKMDRIDVIALKELYNDISKNL